MRVHEAFHRGGEFGDEFRFFRPEVFRFAGVGGEVVELARARCCAALKAAASAAEDDFPRASAQRGQAAQCVADGKFAHWLRVAAQQREQASSIEWRLA